MKKILLALFAVCFLGGTAAAQDNQDTELDSFERCNNWARHYCQAGNHEMVVNQKLLELKKRGYIITTALIKSYAQRTRPRAEGQTQQN